MQLLLVVAKAQSSGRGSHVIFLQLALDEALIPGPRDVTLCGVRRSGVEGRSQSEPDTRREERGKKGRRTFDGERAVDLLEQVGVVEHEVPELVCLLQLAPVRQHE